MHTYTNLPSIVVLLLLLLHEQVPVRREQRHPEVGPRGETAKEAEESGTRWNYSKRLNRLCGLLRGHLLCQHIPVLNRRLATFVAWSCDRVPVFLSSSLKHDLFYMYSLAVLSHSHPRFAYYILGQCGHALSQGGRQPAAPKPRLTTCTVYIGLGNHWARTRAHIRGLRHFSQDEVKDFILFFRRPIHLPGRHRVRSTPSAKGFLVRAAWGREMSKSSNVCCFGLYSRFSSACRVFPTVFPLWCDYSATYEVYTQSCECACVAAVDL